MMDTKIVMIAVGLPASGKSTFIKKYDNVTIISSDNHIENYAKSQNKTYDEVFSEYVNTATKLAKQDFRNAIDNNDQLIYIDQTNMSVKSRRRWLSIVPKDYKKVAIVFHCEYNEIMRREQDRRKTGKSISEDVYKDMLSRYEEPTYEENLDLILKGNE